MLLRILREYWFVVDWVENEGIDYENGWEEGMFKYLWFVEFLFIGIVLCVSLLIMVLIDFLLGWVLDGCVVFGV